MEYTSHLFRHGITVRALGLLSTLDPVPNPICIPMIRIIALIQRANEWNIFDLRCENAQIIIRRLYDMYPFMSSSYSDRSRYTGSYRRNRIGHRESGSYKNGFEKEHSKAEAPGRRCILPYVLVPGKQRPLFGRDRMVSVIFCFFCFFKRERGWRDCNWDISPGNR